MIGVLVLVTFSEPLIIGVAVTPMKVVAAADASEAVVEAPDRLLVSNLDEVLAAPSLEDGGELVDTEVDVCSSVDRIVWDVLVLGSAVGSAAAEAELAS